MKCRSAAILSSLILAGLILAQDSPLPPVGKPVVAEVSKQRLEALKQVTGPLEESGRELDKLRLRLGELTSQDDRELIEAQIKVEQERLTKLRKNFRDIIGGAEAAEYEGETPQDLSIEQLAIDLVEPISRAVQDLSASPRELDALRDRLGIWQEKVRKCTIILERIDRLRAANHDPDLVAEFDLTQRMWEGKKAECQGQIGVIKDQIRERESKRRPVLEAISASFSKFFRSKGINLLLALITGVAVFLIFRRIYEAIRKVSPIHRGKPSLASRLSDVLAGVVTVLISLWGVVLVFYVRGDWLLLTVVVLFLIGAVWAAKTSLPPYFEQVRTLLNLGSIREGERVIYEGLPFRVRSLGFLTTLDNPRLQGGEYRIPVKKVMHMISRLPEDKEPWFPTEVNDWVVMSDGTYGKVITQTPEQVVLLQLGGSMKTYPSAAFLAGTPENLSHGYRVACTFGIDYKHQTLSTTEVPEIMEKALTIAIHDKFDGDQVRSIKVEFKGAGASSLDLQINIDVAGEMGSRYQVLSRFVQRVCVDTCNEQGWVIPFTQITVHQA